MKTHFPTIHNFVLGEKETEYNAFAIKLQKAESDFFVERILPRVISESPSGAFNTTLHDSMITNRSNVRLVRTIVKQEFRKKGFKPTAKDQVYDLVN